MTPQEKYALKMRLKYGPPLSKNEIIKYLLRIAEKKAA